MSQLRVSFKRDENDANGGMKNTAYTTFLTLGDATSHPVQLILFFLFQLFVRHAGVLSPATQPDIEQPSNDGIGQHLIYI